MVGSNQYENVILSAWDSYILIRPHFYIESDPTLFVFRDDQTYLYSFLWIWFDSLQGLMWCSIVLYNSVNIDTSSGLVSDGAMKKFLKIVSVKWLPF